MLTLTSATLFAMRGSLPSSPLSSPGRGGAVLVETQSALIMRDVVASDCWAGLHGGVVAALSASSVVLEHVHFSSSQARQGSGGALYVETPPQAFASTYLFLANVSLVGNTAGVAGGGAVAGILLSRA